VTTATSSRSSQVTLATGPPCSKVRAGLRVPARPHDEGTLSSGGGALGRTLSSWERRAKSRWTTTPTEDRRPGTPRTTIRAPTFETAPHGRERTHTVQLSPRRPPWRRGDDGEWCALSTPGSYPRIVSASWARDAKRRRRRRRDAAHAELLRVCLVGSHLGCERLALEHLSHRTDRGRLCGQQHQVSCSPIARLGEVGDEQALFQRVLQPEAAAKCKRRWRRRCCPASRRRSGTRVPRRRPSPSVLVGGNGCSRYAVLARNRRRSPLRRRGHSGRARTPALDFDLVGVLERLMADSNGACQWRTTAHTSE